MIFYCAVDPRPCCVSFSIGRFVRLRLRQSSILDRGVAYGAKIRMLQVHTSTWYVSTRYTLFQTLKIYAWCVTGVLQKGGNRFLSTRIKCSQI